jgi:hypothetical protein
MIYCVLAAMSPRRNAGVQAATRRNPWEFKEAAMLMD